jgi:hypothetical protein
MRPNCPVCGSKNRFTDWETSYIVPDEWTLPTKNTICLCLDCGMVWYDNDKTQADYDRYYTERYGYSGALTIHENYKRLDELVELAVEHFPNLDACIVDFGGGEGYIKSKLDALGYTNTFTVNIGDPLPNTIDLLIACHVFEHVYDLRGVMDRLSAHVTGKYLIEVPDADAMTRAVNMPMLDYYQIHVNHFVPLVLDKFFERYSYYPVYQYRRPSLYDNVRFYRVIYEPGVPMRTYADSHEQVTANIKAKVELLKRVNYPVIVWGCGPTALHLLAQVNINVVQYVDMDPAYRGTTIGGMPVLDHVESDAPILVMAQSQRTGIVKAISEAGLNNPVIVL